jgi:hypothetical protein
MSANSGAVTLAEGFGSPSGRMVLLVPWDNGTHGSVRTSSHSRETPYRAAVLLTSRLQLIRESGGLDDAIRPRKLGLRKLGLRDCRARAGARSRGPRPFRWFGGFAC